MRITTNRRSNNRHLISVHDRLDKGDEINFFADFDYLLMGIVLAISILGLVILASASENMYQDKGAMAMIIQIIGLVVGFACALIMAYLDYYLFRLFCFPFYICNILLMCLVFTPLGAGEQGGSTSWLDLGIITYQPSELMKLAMILMIAKILERAQKHGFTIKTYIQVIATFIFPLGLVLIQKDMGQAMVFVFCFLVAVFIGRMPWKYIAYTVAVGGMAIPFVWKFAMNDTRRERFLAFIDPEKYTDYAYQQQQSVTAIGSGGLVGQGIGNGEMNTGKLIPVKLSDSIFAVLGEETGFIGCFLVLLLLTVLLLRMLTVSKYAREPFGQIVSAGIFAMFAFNIFENIGMNLGIMPITGLPLPFVSKGGSAMITNYIAVGVLLSISMRKRNESFF